MSITDELRKWAEDNTLKDMMLPTCPPQHVVRGVLETLLRIADRIDAEHQKAMDELKAIGGSMWQKGYGVCHDELMEGHPVIVADLEKYGWVRLPVDADGEYIHMGDRMENGELVARIVLTDGSWEPTVYTAAIPNQLHEYYCHDIRHYHAPTVEDMLWELLGDIRPDMEDEEAVPIVAAYAKRLRLADGKEQ